MSINSNIATVLRRIEQACRRCGRDPETVNLIAVTKTVGSDRIKEAVQAGVMFIGENRVQEAWQKFDEVGKEVAWHMIGHLQTNKVRRVLKFADMVQSVDSLHLAKALHVESEKLNREIDVLIQVNTSDEESKFGLSPAQVADTVDEMSSFGRVKIRGLMTIGAFVPNPEQTRPSFRKLRELRDTIAARQIKGVEMQELSMGMTNDFEVAIEEGATMVRIGRSIFGGRN